MKIKILQGVPASGKTTYALDYCNKNTDWFRVSRDDIRNMRGKYWLPKDEQIITDIEKSCIKFALEHNKNVIVDAMNLNPNHLRTLKDYIKSIDPNTQITIKKFHVDIVVAIDRDSKRSNPVGEKVIREIYNKYFKIEPKVLKQDISLPSAIICDIDGTIADRVDRSPFEWDRVDEDIAIQPIIDIICKYNELGTEIIFLSGRDGVCYDKTLKWINNNVGFTTLDTKLYMRDEGDMRKDNIIKTELFDKHIRDKYNVLFVLDDRDQVVKMWREEMGLTCLQVNYGDF